MYMSVVCSILGREWLIWPCVSGNEAVAEDMLHKRMLCDSQFQVQCLLVLD